MLAVVITLCLGVLAAAMPQAEKPFYDLELAEKHFQDFMQKHNKQYATEYEIQLRFEIFKRNLMEINELNAKSDHAIFGITKFTDLTLNEFRVYNNLKVGSGADSCSVINEIPVSGDLPTNFSWQSKNAVTKVKDQKSCGSCWAFSVIGNVEGQYAIKYGKLVSLSEQELVDCDNEDSGCDGGYMDVGMRQLVTIGVVMSDKSYPYVAKGQECVFDKKQVVAIVKDCNVYNLTNEEHLRKVLYQVGPLSVGINADGLKHYDGGILNVKRCPAAAVNHGVVLVGFGEENGVPYWLLKNSWGESFGNNGFFKLKRNENTCNILEEGAVNAILA